MKIGSCASETLYPTNISFQLATLIAKQDKPIFYIDTEGGSERGKELLAKLTKDNDVK